MLYRKIESRIESYLKSDSNKMLLVDGARQVGKSFIIRHVGERLFPNFIEVNMELDKSGNRLFAQVGTTEDFYLALSTLYGAKMKDKESTLVFIDEIQAYPQLLTLVKFLMADGRFKFIASGSLLGVTLRKTQSIPIGSIGLVRMFPLDFEEFLLACGVGREAVDALRHSFDAGLSLGEPMHDKMMDLFRKYLLVGGMPDCVNTYLSETNIVKIRQAQNDIHSLYADDAAKYENDNGKKLKIRRIYQLMPSNLENRKKRIVAKEIEGRKGGRMTDYQDEFDYLISSGVALDVKAISQPSFPLVQRAGKNLLKLYLNDVGIFSGILYGPNIQAIMEDVQSISLGSVYENVVAQELKAHGRETYYYDNKRNGEVDFLIDDYDSLSVLPIEVKSGKDYTEHSAIDKFLATPNYNIRKGYVLSNNREVISAGALTYLPIYYIMFLGL